MRDGGLMGEIGIKYVMNTHTLTQAHLYMQTEKCTHKHTDMQVHALSFLLER